MDCGGTSDIKTPISAMNLLLQTMEENDRAQRKEAVKELKVELFKTEQYGGNGPYLFANGRYFF